MRLKKSRATRKFISAGLVHALFASLLALFSTAIDTAISSTPASAAETLRSQTFNYNGAISTWTIPNAATQVRFIIVGGGGGYGGLDCGSGCTRVPPSNTGYVVTDWIAKPTSVRIGPGSSGGGGADCARWGGGGSAGFSPFGYNGGAGGAAGGAGCSGGGGGGGAASVVELGGTFAGLIVAGGAGGGGGNGNFRYTSTMVGKNSYNSTGTITGGNGAGPGGSDGGGGGGGGGGRWGSTGSGVYWAGGEYGGVGGYIGANGKTSSIGISSNTTIWRQNFNGYVTVEWYEASVPGAPVAPTVVSRGDGQVTLSWSQPSDTGGSGVAITGYELSRSTGEVCATTNGSTFSATCTGLINGTTYNFRVRAQNFINWGSYSGNTSAIPRTVPSTMSAPSPTPGNGLVALTWTAPNNNGAAITSYTVQYSAAVSATRSWVNVSGLTGTSTNITGLTNGTPYVFRIWATNEAGSSPVSAESTSVIPRTNPSAPTSFVVAGVGDAQVSLSWQLPSSNGGLAITDYIVEFALSNSATFTVFNDGVNTNNSVIITGLSNGSSYKFRVKARNSGNLDSVYTSELTATPITIPGAPASLSTDWPSCTGECSGRINLSWSAPTSNGGTDVTGYVVQIAVKPADGVAPTWSTATTTIASATTVTLTGLTNGTTYIYRIAATNSVGTGAYREDLTGRAPRALPGTPGNLQVTNVGNAQVSLSWSAPASNGGSAITDYKIEYRIGADGAWTEFSHTASTATTITVTGLTNGTGYQFRISAVNAAGTGVATSASNTATPVTIPAKAVITSADISNQSIIVTIGSFSNGGTALTAIQYSIDNGASWQNSAVTSGQFTISNLTNGTAYALRIRGINLVGPGEASDALSRTPYTIPGAPTNLAVGQESSTQVLITWLAPSSNGGSVITDYVVQYRVKGDLNWLTFADGISTLTRAQVTSLTNGTTYEFQVFAKNAAGDSLQPSNIVEAIPRTFPGAPTLNSVTSGNTELTVVWTAPTDNGGTPITGYNIFFTANSVTRSLSVGNVTTTKITGLVNGTEYQITVRALSGGGQGTASNAISATPAFTPSAPQNLSVVAGTKQLVVTWSAPASNGGNAVSAYKVEHSTNNSTWTEFSDSVAGTTATITGLSAKTPYYVRVSAKNQVGFGAVVTTAQTTTPFDVPTQPVIDNTKTLAYPSKVDVVFNTTGVDNMGSAITGFKVYTFLNDANKTSVNRSCTTATAGDEVTCSVTGLTDKTQYIFAVVAINAAGESAILTYSSVKIPGALDQTITVVTPTNFKFGDRAWSLDAKATSGLPVKYEEVTPSICTLVGATTAEKESLGLVFANSAGSCTIKITQAGNNTYNNAPDVNVTFTIAAIAPSAPAISSALGTTSNNLVINWNAPTSTGGTNLTKYVVEVRNSAGTAVVESKDVLATDLTTSFTGLAVGNYKVVVIAHNTAGNTASAQASADVFVIPNAPTGVTLTTGDRSLTVSWTPGTDSMTTTGYLAQASLTSDPFTSVAQCTTVSATSCVITGLNQDTTYFVRVFQSNAFATSVASATASLQTGQIAQSVSSITLKNSSNQEIAISSNAATVAINAGPVSIAVALSSNLPATISTTSSACSYDSATNRITLLSADSCILKINQSGVGNAFAALTEQTLTLTITAVAPSAPVITGISPTGTAGQLKITWSAPTNNGGSAITNYRLTVDGGTEGANLGNVLETTISNLAPGNHTFVVRAINAANLSASSLSASYLIVIKPSAPALISVSTGDRSLVVVWSPSTNDGGNAITGYRVTATSAGVSKSCTTNATANSGENFTCTVTGLVNDATYTISVVADNGYFISDPDTTIGEVSQWKAGDLPQTVTLTNPGTKTFGDAAFSLSASSDSNQSLTFSTSTPTICKVDSATGRVDILLAGDCTITATQDGVGNAYASASDTESFNIAAVAPGAASISNIYVNTSGFTTTGGEGAGQLVVILQAPTSLGGAATATYTVTTVAPNISLTCGTPNASGVIECVSTASGITFASNIYSLTFSVTATTATGLSTTTAAQSYTVYRPDPGAPRNLGVPLTVSNGVVSGTASWTSPSSSGASGSSISSYTLKLYKGNSATAIDEYTVRVDSPSYSSVADATATPTNYISYYFGKRYIWGSVAENGSLTLTAPSGYRLKKAAFASYGLPNLGTETASQSSATSTPPAWKHGTCHATTSMDKINESISANFSAITVVGNNSTFGDPCMSQGKTLAVVVELEPTTAFTLDAGSTYRLEITATNNEPLSRTMGYTFTTPTTPGAVQGLTGTVGSGSVSLSWSAPISDGGSSITGYTVLVSNSNNQTNGTVSISGTSATVTGLNNGTTYSFSVNAVNAIGSSTDTRSISLKPFGVADAPATATAIVTNGLASNSTSITWSITAGSENGSAITHYVTTVKSGSTFVTSCLLLASATELNCTFSNLAPGTYTAEVVAYNAAGASAAKVSEAFTVTALANSLTFRGQKAGDEAASTVQGNAISVEYGSAPITFSATSASGAAVALASTTTSICSLSAAGVVTFLNYTIAGATQSCVVTATTSEPSGSLYVSGSATLTITVSALPTSAPTGVAYTLSGGNVNVSWTAPTYLGGSPITGYTITATPSTGSATTFSATAGATSATLTGLVSTLSYTITVKSNNDSTTSAISSANVSSSISVLSAPGAPITPTALKDEQNPGRVTVSWTAPSGEVSSYSVIVRLKASPNTEVGSCSTTTTSCVISGIPTGEYTIFVTAINSRGEGVAATVDVSVGLTQTLSFKNAAGTSITELALNYGDPAVRIFGSSDIGAPTTLSLVNGSDYCAVSGDQLSLKIFTVATGTTVTCELKIAAGATASHLGAEATLTVTITLKKPDAPRDVQLIPGDKRVTVNWVAPASLGGSQLTKYYVYYKSVTPGSTPVFDIETPGPLGGRIEHTNFNSLSTTITGLLNGYNYAVKISAINAVGEGEKDPEIIPAGPPGQVADATAVGGNRTITVSWKAPQNTVENGTTIFGDGGKPIKGFEVSAVNDPQGTFKCLVAPTSEQLSNQATVYSCAISVPVNKVAYSISILTTTEAGTSTTNLPSVTPEATQTITVTTPSTADSFVNPINYGTNYQIVASASSGLALTFASSNTGSCTVTSSGLVSALAVGSCDITISQAGNEVFNAATSVVKKFTVSAIVNPSKPVVSAIKSNGATIEATLSWGGSDLTPIFRICKVADPADCTNLTLATVTSSSTGALSVSTTELAPSTQYTVVLNATPAVGTAQDSAATTFTTLETPVISSEITTFDALSTYAIQLTGDPTSGTGNFSAWAITAGSLPSGLSLDTNTGVISGTVNTTGDFSTAISGTVTIEVTDSGGNKGSKVFNYLIQGANQNLSIGDIANRPYSTATITALVTAPDSAVITFSSSTTTVCTVNSSTGLITILRDGECTITASTAAFGSYRAGTASDSFLVSKANQVVSFAATSGQTFAPNATFNVAATSNSGLTVNYGSNSESICTVNATSGVVTILAAGNCVVTAKQTPAGDAINQFNESDTVTQTIVIAKATPTIEITSPTTLAYKGKSTVTAAISGGGTLSLTSGNSSALQVTGVEIEALTGTGVVTLTLNSAESANYLAGSRTVNITLTRASQSINDYTVPNQTFSPNKEVTLSATSSSLLDVSYSSADLAIATISGNKLTIKGAGTVTITMSQGGNNDNYLPAPDRTFTLTIDKATQVISIGGFPTTATFGDANRKLTPENKSDSISNNRLVTLRTTTADVCSLEDVSDNADANLNGTFLQIIGVGDCVISGANAGDGDYAAVTTNFTVKVEKASRTISISTDPAAPTPPLTITFLNETVELTATASADDIDDKSFVVTSGPCTIEGTTLNSTGAGTCVITATIAAGGRYLTATQNIEVVINKAAQTITDVIRGKLLTQIKAPDLPAGAESFSVASVEVVPGTEVTKSDTPGQSSVLVRLEVMMTDPAAPKPDDIEIVTSISGRVVSAIAALTKGVLTDRVLVVIESERAQNETINVVAPGLPEDATSFTVTSNLDLGALVQVGDVVAVLTPVGAGPFDPATIEVIATEAGKVATRIAPGTTGIQGSATIATFEPAIKIGGKTAIRATKGAGTASLTYTSLTPTLCSIAADEFGVQRVTGIELGVCRIEIAQATDQNYLATSVIDTFLVARGDQEIVVTTVETIKYSDAPAPVEVQAAAGAVIELITDNESVAKVENNRIVPAGVGEVLLEVRASATERFNAATPVTRLIIVEKGVQTLNFTAPASGNVGATLDVVTSATSTLPVALTSLTPAVCVVESGKIRLIGPGECRVSALQEGSELWEEADPVVRTLQSIALATGGGGGTLTAEQLEALLEAAKKAQERIDAIAASKAAREEAAKKAEAEREAKEALAIERANRTQVDGPVRTVANQQLPTPTSDRSLLLIDGRETFITQNVVNKNQLSLVSRGIRTTIASSPDTRQLRDVRDDNTVRVVEQDYLVLGGSGYKPNSTIKVWAFSEPIFLGEFKVDSTGAYSGNLPLSASIKAGEHRIQINSVIPDGRIHSVTIAIQVEPKPVEPVVVPDATAKSVRKTVLFAKSSTVLDSAEKKLVKSYRNLVKNAESITCIAYTTKAKPSKVQKRLAEARAKATCTYLMPKQLTGFKISVKGVATAPKATRTAANKAVRVDISISRK